MTTPPGTQVIPLGNGRYELVSGSTRTLAYAVRRRGETWVFINGRAWIIAAGGRPSARPGRQHDAAALAAPMPATVVSISVQAGQKVKAGDHLVTLEAMKMEVAITAPHDGTVRGVACRIGELVQPGVPLVDLE